MGHSHTLAILLTILFHTLEQVVTVIEFVTTASFGVIIRISRSVFKHATRVCGL